MHPAEQLWQKHQALTDYPLGVLPITEAIRGTAFFPGGYGLDVEDGQSLPAFPVGGTMILGHDFHSEDGYLDSLQRGFESPTQPTWRNLRTLLTAAQIPIRSCFFTNFFMGLRAGSATTGTFPGARHASFISQCGDFFLVQLQAQRPTLILTLGIEAPFYIAPLSPQLAAWGDRRGIRHLDFTGPVRFDVHFPALPSYTTTVVALAHPSLRHANVRHRRFEDLIGDAAELRMIAAAKARIGAPSL
jgi:uracil-DNA glycosylase